MRARMWTWTGVLLPLLLAAPGSAVSIDWVPIGNPGNPADTRAMTCCNAFTGTSGFGSVPYPYQISKYEITNGQYTEFLNAVAVLDAYGLASGAGQFNFGIARTGSQGSYSYSAKPGLENEPVALVSWFDALRFTNWLNNGQPTGLQSSQTTETGSYTLDGSVIASERNASAIFALPTENEWYKAAYYDGASSSYRTFPFQAAGSPSCQVPPGTTTRSADCGFVQPPAGFGPVPVGSYPNSPGPSGTFDQGGNVWEWVENDRVLRGGTYGSSASDLSALFRGDVSGGSVEQASIGFRIVMLVPEPGTGVLLLAGMIGLAGWRRRHD